jgi:acetyltransferase-like isoleucine patch superfamily enzyme
VRELLKFAARAVALVAVLPSLISYLVKSVFLGRDRALEGSTQLLSLAPGIVGQYLRQAFLARALAGGCAASATISFATIFSKAGARIDERAYIGPGCFLGLVHIERDVLIGSGVHVTSGKETHGTADPDVPMREQAGRLTLVRVGAGAWIGSGAIVMADVGANSIVGAGSVVTKPVPAEVIAAGVPATVIRSRREADASGAWRGEAGAGAASSPGATDAARDGNASVATTWASGPRPWSAGPGAAEPHPGASGPGDLSSDPRDTRDPGRDPHDPHDPRDPRGPRRDPRDTRETPHATPVGIGGKSALPPGDGPGGASGAP